MIRRLFLSFALILGVAFGASSSNAAYGGEISHGSPTGKYAVGFASFLLNAEFRISADCPASPDRHTGWKRQQWVSYETGNCVFNWTITKSYAGLRSL
jgi:hypothetical protein